MEIYPSLTLPSNLNKHKMFAQLKVHIRLINLTIGDPALPHGVTITLKQPSVKFPNKTDLKSLRINAYENISYAMSPHT